MRVSRDWLQTYFEKPLPSVAEIAEAFTFHAFEIEEATGEMLDVKVLPNRAADCFSHRGIARELSAILDTPLKSDPLREPSNVDLRSPHLRVEIEDPKKCSRYMGAVVKGVKVGPPPDWLKGALEAVGQRSINNIVDATNYVMLNIGQPLHAFDAGKLKVENGTWKIGVRSAKESEKITTLSNEEFTLSSSISLITDANADVPIALAGIKGGKAAEITDATTDIIIESANFDGTTTRRAAQALKLFTDASARFQNRPSPELCAYGIRDVLAIIKDVAGGEVEGVVDVYPIPAQPNLAVSVTLGQINGILGSDFSLADVESVFRRLELATQVTDETFTVTPPFERTDLVIPEDLVEEVGRIMGYDTIAPVLLPAPATAPDQMRFRGIEKMKDMLVEQGFTEVSTQSFAEKGDIMLANPLDTTKPALRTSLEGNLNEALERAKRYAPLVLAPNETPKLFEVGTVFPKAGEYLELRTVPSEASLPDEALAKLGAKEGDLSKIVDLEDYGKDYEPKKYQLGAYKSFSVYPFIVRDIAFWVPKATDAMSVAKLIHDTAGSLLHQTPYKFDEFQKGEKTSLAFRLIFQSPERTLTDDEINGIMKGISDALTSSGYEVR